MMERMRIRLSILAISGLWWASSSAVIAQNWLKDRRFEKGQERFAELVEDIDKTFPEMLALTGDEQESAKRRRDLLSHLTGSFLEGARAESLYEGLEIQPIIRPPGDYPNDPTLLQATLRMRYAYATLGKALIAIPECPPNIALALYVMGEIDAGSALDVFLQALCRPIDRYEIFLGKTATLGKDPVLDAIQLALRTNRGDELSALAPANDLATNFAVRNQFYRLRGHLPLYLCAPIDFAACAAHAIEAYNVGTVRLIEIAEERDLPVGVLADTLRATWAQEKWHLDEGNWIKFMLAKAGPSDEPILSSLVAALREPAPRSESNCRYLVKAILEQSSLAIELPNLALEIVRTYLFHFASSQNPQPHEVAVAGSLLSRHIEMVLRDSEWRKPADQIVGFVRGRTANDKGVIPELAVPTFELASVMGGIEDREGFLAALVPSMGNQVFDAVSWLAEQGMFTEALALVDRAKARDCRHPKGNPSSFLASAEMVVGRELTQRSVFTAIVLADAALSDDSTTAERPRARKMLRDLASRWGTLEHARPDLLEMGLIYLVWRGNENVELFLSPLALWRSQNNIDDAIRRGECPKLDDAGESTHSLQYLWRSYLKTELVLDDPRALELLVAEAERIAAIPTPNSFDAKLPILVDIGVSGHSYRTLKVRRQRQKLNDWLRSFPTSSPTSVVTQDQWQQVLDGLDGKGCSKENREKLLKSLFAFYMKEKTRCGWARMESALNLADAIHRDPLFLAEYSYFQWNVAEMPPASVAIEAFDRCFGKRQGRDFWLAKFLLGRQWSDPLKEGATSPPTPHPYEPDIAWLDSLAAASKGTWMEPICGVIAAEPANYYAVEFSPVTYDVGRRAIGDLPPAVLLAYLADGSASLWLSEEHDLVRRDANTRWLFQTYGDALEALAKEPPKDEFTPPSFSQLSYLLDPIRERNPDAFDGISARLMGNVVAARRLEPTEQIERTLVSIERALAPPPPPLPKPQSPAQRRPAPERKYTASQLIILELEAGNMKGALEILLTPGVSLQFSWPEDVADIELVKTRIAALSRTLVAAEFERWFYLRLLAFPSDEAELVTLCKRFDTAVFKDKRLEEACFRRLVNSRDTSRHLPVRMTAWWDSLGDGWAEAIAASLHYNPNDDTASEGFSPVFSYSYLAGYRADVDAIHKLVSYDPTIPEAFDYEEARTAKYLYESQISRIWKAITGGIRVGMTDGLASPERLSALAALGSELLSIPRDNDFRHQSVAPLNRSHQRLLAATLLGHGLATGASPVTLEPFLVAAGDTSSRTGANPGRQRGYRDQIGYAIEAATVAATTLAMTPAEKAAVFDRVWLQFGEESLQPRLTAAHQMALEAGLLDAGSAMQRAIDTIAAHGDSCGSSWARYDLARVYEQVGENAKALEILLQLERERVLAEKRYGAYFGPYLQKAIERLSL
ncbi:hypothetical protein BH23VER1_BH23VER1_28180 [soil metagenome]